MDLDEFTEYLEKNCRAQEIFLLKAIDYQNEKNNARKPASRWTTPRIEKEADKMWKTTVKSLYANLTGNIKGFKRESWLNFISENEVLDLFTDGIDDMEFE